MEGFIAEQGRTSFRIYTSCGFVRCSTRVMLGSVGSVESLLGKWLKLNYSGTGKLLEVTKVGKLPDKEIPFNIDWDKKENSFVKVTTRVRAVVGSVFPDFGTAWSPTVGRIHISLKHVSNRFHNGEELDMSVMLNVESNPELWVTVRIWGQRHPDPFPFLRWCAGKLKLFNGARVAETKNSFWGVLRGSDQDNSELIRVLPRDLPPIAEGGRMNLGRLANDGVCVQVLAYRETDPDQRNATWRALTVLPLGTFPRQQVEVPERNGNGVVDAIVQTEMATQKEMRDLKNKLNREEWRSKSQRMKIGQLEEKVEMFRQKAEMEGEKRWEMQAQLAAEQRNCGHLAKRVSDLEEAVLCPICVERKTDMVLRCGHLFCGVCFLQVHNRCPICRQEVTEKINIYPLWGAILP